MAYLATYGDWWDLAACQTADPELFFPVSATGGSRAEIARAKAICATCPIRQQCLDYALDTRQPHGVWGGRTEEERHQIIAAHQRQLIAQAS
jgi:WhiB family transcriptional regulator, redox-sensing transcriptional regulator